MTTHFENATGLILDQNLSTAEACACLNPQACLDFIKRGEPLTGIFEAYNLKPLEWGSWTSEGKAGIGFTLSGTTEDVPALSQWLVQVFKEHTILRQGNRVYLIAGISPEDYLQKGRILH